MDDRTQAARWKDFLSADPPVIAREQAYQSCPICQSVIYQRVYEETAVRDVYRCDRPSCVAERTRLKAEAERRRLEAEADAMEAKTA